MPFMDTTAISVVPPPMSTTICPFACPMLTPAPSMAARGSWIRFTFREPALRAASITARRSTSVIKEGTQIIIRGLISCLPLTLRINSRIIHWVSSSSEITPSFRGRTTAR